jgi:pilus assembly protein CpaF
MDSAREIVDRVREAVTRGSDTRTAIESELSRVNEQALWWAKVDDVNSDDISPHIDGFGDFQQFLDDPTVEEIWVNGESGVFIAREGTHVRTDLVVSRESIMTIVERMLRLTGRRIDYSQPFVDASLPDGSRLHVVIPPITRGEWSVNIRKFSQSIRTLAQLVDAGSLPESVARDLSDRVRGGASILVAGATQAGKTTMLTALCGELADGERVITVEETFELALPNSDVVGLQCRGPSLEGIGEVTLRRLVRETLRMRPTRIVVGEVRGDEALDLLVALNSGVPGLCTIHAKSARDAVRKLSTLCQIAGGVSADFVMSTIAATVDVVVHCEMSADGVRRVTEVASLTTGADGIEVVPTWVK